MKNLVRPTLVVFAVLAISANCFAANSTKLRNICRIKGQEENTLRGYGLVVGLNGTGDSGDGPTMRALARMMENLGSPVSMTGRLDAASLEELRKVKNAAAVIVTATVPATGARRGDKIDCHITAISGKSLAGGRLVTATLLGPNPQDPRVFALCEGPLELDDPEQPMTARVRDGCQMEQDVFTPFHKDGHITLVLDRNHANFVTAEAIVARINESSSHQAYGAGQHYSQAGPSAFAYAINAANIRVKIPEVYLADPVSFAAQLMEQPVYETEPESRVVVNPRLGTIVIDGDIEIGAVVITHRNLTIEATAIADFAAVNPSRDAEKPKLERLVAALGNLKVPPEDIIEIIRGIHRAGKLHARLIVE